MFNFLVFKMKSFKSIGLILIMAAICLSNLELYAQNGQGKMNQNRGKIKMKADSTCDNLNRYQNFVDEDGDGNCDNKSSLKSTQSCKTNCVNFVDANNDGKCDNQGSKKNFVDANNDGICDNGNNCGLNKGKKQGKGKGSCKNDVQSNITSTLASPNPFTGNTNITFETKMDGVGSVKLYDINGTLIKTLYEGSITIGSHSYNYNAEDLIPGKYIFKIQLNNEIKAIPVIYTK